MPGLLKRCGGPGVVLLAVVASLCGCRSGQNGGAPQPQADSAPPPQPRVPKVQKVRPSSEKVQPPAPPPSPESVPRADVTARRRSFRVAALGDSITDESVGGGGYLRYLRKACPQSEFIHFGKGGDMTNQMRRRLLRDLLPAHRNSPFDTLIVFGGVNDLYSDVSAGRSNTLIEADLGAIYAEAHQANLRVVAVTVSPWGGFSRYFNARRSRSTRLLNSWILGTPAEGRTDAVVDSYPLLSCGDPERLCPAYENKRPDGLHPGPLGHEKLGEALLRVAFADCQ